MSSTLREGELGRLKHTHKAVEPAGEARPHREIVVDIARAMGVGMKEARESEIKRLAKVKAKPQFRPFEKKEWLDVSYEAIIESVNASVINGSRLLWLKEIEKAVKSNIVEVHE